MGGQWNPHVVDLPSGKDEKVKADADDPAPGFLNDKLSADEMWLHQSVAGGQVRLEHIGPQPAVDFRDIIDAEVITGAFGKVLRIWSEEVTFDDKGHYTWEGQWNNHDVDLPDEKVAADWMDLQPSFLTDKLIVDETWLHKSIVGGQVKIEHGGPWDYDPGRVEWQVQGDEWVYGVHGRNSITFDARGHQQTGVADRVIEIKHDVPQAEDSTLDPVISVTVDGTSLRITSQPASLDACGHVRRPSSGQQQNHDLALVSATVVTAVQVSGTLLQARTRTIYVPKADAESDWVTIHTGTDCPQP